MIDFQFGTQRIGHLASTSFYSARRVLLMNLRIIRIVLSPEGRRECYRHKSARFLPTSGRAGSVTVKGLR